MHSDWKCQRPLHRRVQSAKHAAWKTRAYFAPAALSMVLNSPDLYISIVVSQPPMNSPFTNTCDDVSTVRIPASACDQAAAPIRGMHAPAGWSASW